MAKSKKFNVTFGLVLRHDLEFKHPSNHEIIVKYLKKEVKNTSFAFTST